ncbi:hypothetical protein EDB19DRAFT_1723203 [Suillus lakei]|nr:hypothetical protein EDB19DRAFT_1723203 [Suillus lakei]
MRGPPNQRTDDIQYVKPSRTPNMPGGQESLRTHGYFKEHFDGPIRVNQIDILCMSLYKRGGTRIEHLMCAEGCMMMR